MSHKSKLRAAAAVAALVAVAAVGAAGGALSSGQLAASPTSPVSSPRQLPASLADIVERVGPAVVSIRVTRQTAENASASLPDLPDSLKRFFGEDFARRFFERREGWSEPRVSGMGSGFFIDTDGHAVTNNHVVDEASKIEVVLSDGEVFEATLIGRDPKTDLALLKVDADRTLPHVRFGSSAGTRVGDWVIAIGSPFGLRQTATVGIVSARSRDIGSGPYDNFLQIDASINRGNSGGPAFNLEGEVIGVNTAIMSPTGTNAGVGFAVPSDMAQRIVEQLKAAGKVSRGWLGVAIQTVTEDLASGLGLETAEGALVSNVTENSPAAAAGLRQGDVIVAVDGKRVGKMRELPRIIADIPSGTRTALTVLRDRVETEIAVKIGDMPETATVVAEKKEDEVKTRLGMTLAKIDEALRERFDLADDVDGVVVVETDPSGVAAGKGVRPGDVIRQISGEKPDAPSEVAEAVEDALKASGDKKPLLLLVRRGGSDLFVALPLS